MWADPEMRSRCGRLGYQATCRKQGVKTLSALRERRRSLELMAAGWPAGARRVHARILEALERCPRAVPWRTVMAALGFTPDCQRSRLRGALRECVLAGWAVAEPVVGFKPGWPRLKYSLAPAVALARLVARNQREGV